MKEIIARADFGNIVSFKFSRNKNKRSRKQASPCFKLAGTYSEGTVS